MVTHVSCIIYSFQKNFLSSTISEQAVVITSDITFIYPKVFQTENYTTLLKNLLHLLTEFCYMRARHRYYNHKLSYKANFESSHCNLRVCENGVKPTFLAMIC